MKRQKHKGSAWQQALQCAKGHGGWDPARDCARSGIAVEDAVGLVVWKAPHQIILAGTVSDEQTVLDATKEVPGGWSDRIQEALRRLPPKKGLLRTLILHISDRPVITAITIKI